jgi:ribosomal 50S subunit-recycling heat shock protein
MEVQMIEFQSNNASGWVKFLTMPARRCENGNLVLRGASVAKASYQITPGQDIAIAVFKNDDSYSISLSFKQKTEA